MDEASNISLTIDQESNISQIIAQVKLVKFSLEGVVYTPVAVLGSFGKQALCQKMGKPCVNSHKNHIGEGN